MNLTADQISDAAARLVSAEGNRDQIGLLTQQYPDMDMDDAYGVQKGVVAHKISLGRKVIGWKIGLTSKAMQYALNIDIPDSGVLKAPISGENVTRADVIAATDYVTPSLEILDTRIIRQDAATGQVRSVIDTISDNAANAGLVLGGERHAVDAFDLRWVGAITRRNGEVEETGLGAGVLDDPVESVVWLARRMSQYGQKIMPGDVILSGSFIRPVETMSGALIEADFGPFGSVSCRFE